MSGQTQPHQDRPCMKCRAIAPYPLAFCQRCLGMTEGEYDSVVQIGRNIMERGLEIPENPDEMTVMLLEALRRQASIWQQPGLSRDQRGEQLLENANATGRGVLRLIRGGKP